MTITHYHFQTASHIVSGAHSLELLGEKLDGLGLSGLTSIFILTQPSIVSLGYADHIKSELTKKESQVRSVQRLNQNQQKKILKRYFRHFYKGSMTPLLGLVGECT